jgi:hypothetical protein
MNCLTQQNLSYLSDMGKAQKSAVVVLGHVYRAAA